MVFNQRKEVILYLLYTIFTILFIYYQKYQFRDTAAIDKLSSIKIWHILGLMLRLWAVVLFITPSLIAISITFQDILLIGTLNAVIWELGINKIALNTNWFHIGTTSVFDKKFRKYKWWFLFILLVISITIKIFI